MGQIGPAGPGDVPEPRMPTVSCLGRKGVEGGCLLHECCRAVLNAAVRGELVAALCLFTSHLGSSFLWEPQHLFSERILSLSHELSAMRREGLNQNVLPATLQEEVAERRR